MRSYQHTVVVSDSLKTDTIRERTSGAGTESLNNLLIGSGKQLRSDQIQERTTNSGITSNSNLIVSSGKTLKTNTLSSTTGGGTPVAVSTGLTVAADVQIDNNSLLKVDQIQKNSGSYIVLGSSLVQMSGFVATPNITADNLNENTLAAGVTSTANLKVAAGKTLSTNTLAPTTGSTVSFSGYLENASEGVKVANCYADSLREYTASNGVVVQNTLKLNTAASSSADKLLVWDSTGKSVGYAKAATVRGYGMAWLEDFAGAVPGSWSGVQANVSCDKPWQVNSDNVGNVYIGFDSGPLFLNQAGEYLSGAIYPYINGSADADHYWAFNSYQSFYREKGDITFDAQFRIPYAWGSGYYDSLQLFMGFGSNSFNGSNIVDMDYWSGLFYDSGTDNQHWLFTQNDSGVNSISYSTSSEYLSTVLLRFKMVVKSSSIEYWLNNGSGGAMSLNYTAGALSYPAQKAFQPRFSMRLNPSLSASAIKLGMIVDYIRVTQDWNRF